MASFVQFYAFRTDIQKRGICSFKVTNKSDAIHALARFNVPFGWYVVRSGGTVIKNEKIENRYYSKVQNEGIFDKIDKFLAL